LDKYSYLYGVRGGTSYFTGLSFIYDDRDVLNFTSKGTYIRLNPSISLHGISTLNTMEQINFTGVEYLKFSRTVSLGLNLVANTIIGKQVPFFLLYQLGGANIERGYYQGRYRDKTILAGQAEFKYHFLARLALAAFIGTGTTWGYEPFDIHQFKPSYGGGIHYIFSIQNRLSLRLDYALGIKPPGEARFHGLYFAIGEAF
jgi:outer membrane protein assembly factor BamA